MSWTLLAVGSIFVFTALNLLQRVLSVDSENPRAMAMIFNSIAALLAIILLTLTEGFGSIRFPNEPQAWIALSAAVLFYGLFERGRFVAAKLLDASVYITIKNLGVLVAFIGSLLLYSEALTSQKLFGAALIIGAILVVSYQRARKKSSKLGIVVGIGVSIMLGLGWTLDKLGATYFSPGGYNVIIWVLPLALIYFPYIKLEDIRSEAKRVSWKIVVLAGINVIGYWMQLRALELAEATRVIPIVQTSIVLTVILGIFILNEKENIPAKIIAGIMAFTGTYFLI